MQIRHLQLDEFLNSCIILEQFSHIISSTYFLYLQRNKIAVTNFIQSSCFHNFGVLITSCRKLSKINVCVYSVTSVMANSLQPCGLQSIRLLCPWYSPGKNTGMGCHAFLQGIFPTQRSNPCLLHCRQNSLPTEPPGMLFLK